MHVLSSLDMRACRDGGWPLGFVVDVISFVFVQMADRCFFHSDVVQRSVGSVFVGF